MWHASGLRESLHDMSAYGINVDESAVQFDFAKLKENRDTYVNRQPLIAHCIAPHVVAPPNVLLPFFLLHHELQIRKEAEQHL